MEEDEGQSEVRRFTSAWKALSEEMASSKLKVGQSPRFPAVGIK